MIALLASLVLAQPVNGCPNPNMTCNGVRSTTGTFTGLLKAAVVDAGVLNVQGQISTIGPIKAGTATLTIGVIDAGTADIANQFGAGNIVINTTSVSGLNFTDSNGTQRITWGGGRYVSWHANGYFMPSGGADGFSASSIGLGTTPRLTDSATAPTVTACSGGTAASMTWNNGSANFRFDVGTACASESTAVITMPTVANCWTCSCFNTAAPTHNIKQSGCATTTATMTNYAATLATVTDWVDSADIQCMCRGG